MLQCLVLRTTNIQHPYLDVESKYCFVCSSQPPDECLVDNGKLSQLKFFTRLHKTYSSAGPYVSKCIILPD